MIDFIHTLQNIWLVLFICALPPFLICTTLDVFCPRWGKRLTNRLRINWLVIKLQLTCPVYATEARLTCLNPADGTRPRPGIWQPIAEAHANYADVTILGTGIWKLEYTYHRTTHNELDLTNPPGKKAGDL